MAIETGHLLCLAFGRPWRQTEGLLRSVTALLGLQLGIPNHTTFSRRSPGLVLAKLLAQARAGSGLGGTASLTSRGRRFRHHHAAAHTDRAENHDPTGTHSTAQR